MAHRYTHTKALRQSASREKKAASSAATLCLQLSAQLYDTWLLRGACQRHPSLQTSIHDAAGRLEGRGHGHVKGCPVIVTVTAQALEDVHGQCRVITAQCGLGETNGELEVVGGKIVRSAPCRDHAIGRRRLERHRQNAR